jgi:hypothetical protein
MQTTPEPGVEANRRRDGASATRVWWVLVVVSGCAALVAFVLLLVSIGLIPEFFAADPYCASPAGLALQLEDNLYTSLVVGGFAALLSFGCAFTSRRSRSGSTRGARFTSSALLILSSLALVGLVCSFCGYTFSAFYGNCLG